MHCEGERWFGHVRLSDVTIYMHNLKMKNIVMEHACPNLSSKFSIDMMALSFPYLLGYVKVVVSC